MIVPVFGAAARGDTRVDRGLYRSESTGVEKSRCEVVVLGQVPRLPGGERVRHGVNLPSRAAM